MKNSDAATKAAKHLSKFHANVATAENEEMLRQSGELHNGFVGEKWRVIETRDRRNTRAAAGIDENFLAFESVITNLELMGANKAGMAAMEPKVRAFVYLFLLAAAKTEHDFIFLGDDFGEINADV